VCPIASPSSSVSGGDPDVLAVHERISDITGARYLFPGFSLDDSATFLLNPILDDQRFSCELTYDLSGGQAEFNSFCLFPNYSPNLTFPRRNTFTYEASGP